MTLCKFSCILLIFSSCTKTEELAPLAQDKILEYKVVNLNDDQVIYGAIDNNKNTITVYIPFYYGLSVIDPEIKLSNGAKLKDENLPIKADVTDMSYTVLASNGVSRTYTLHIQHQNTPSLSVSWPIGSRLSQSPGRFMLAILGNFEHTNPALVKVSFINQENQTRYVMNTGSAKISTNGESQYIMQFGGTSFQERIPVDITEGTYTVEVKSLGHTAQIKEPLIITYRQPSPYLPQSQISLKKDGEWDIIPQLSTVFLGLQKVTATVNGKTYTLPIKSWNRTSIKLTLPADFPSGDLPVVAMQFDFEGWSSISLNAWLNISP
jgi:hypothetical protein